MSLRSLRAFALTALLGFAPLAGAQPPPLPYENSLKLVDFTSWVQAQGRFDRGFLTSSPEGFRWPDGTRARFWGVNIANRNLWIERQEIDRVVEVLAASGCNLLRFEALDSRGALLDIPGVPGTRRLHPQKLDTLHYWIARLRDKGIYYYLDLIDFREFQAQDGVENAARLPRAGRPYAVFDPKLIELQKEYASQLLTTVNPYTKLAPAQDPAMVLLEICNESGFFLYPKNTDNLIEPYRTRFQQRWNQWLKDRYGSRQELARAWGGALRPEENWEQAKIALPQLLKPARGQRQSDGIEFFHDVERAYFATMRDALRAMGVKVPITAVVSSDVPAELAAVAAELDFLSENHYADHPAFGGAEWQGKFFYNNKNALRDDSKFAFAPFTAQLRWESKPVVVREWATVWPNQYRASSIPEAAAYARLQDFDAMILFGYKTGSVRDRLVEFGFQVDPTVWDMFALGSLIFLRGDIATPGQIALLEYTDRALFSAAGANDLVRLGHSFRLASKRQIGTSPAGEVKTFSVESPTVTAENWLKSQPTAAGGRALSGKAYTSSHGQIVRDSGRGRLSLQSPTLLCLAGELSGTGLALGNSLSLNTQTSIGALLALSLDGEDLTQSQRWTLKMASIAENTGQKLIPAPARSPARLVLEEPGSGPVLTFGKLQPKATRITLWNGEPLVVHQLNGTWEFLFDQGELTFWSDTPGSSLEYQGRTLVSSSKEAVPYLKPEKPPAENPFAPTFP